MSPAPPTPQDGLTVATATFYALPPSNYHHSSSHSVSHRIWFYRKIAPSKSHHFFKNPERISCAPPPTTTSIDIPHLEDHPSISKHPWIWPKLPHSLQCIGFHHWNRIESIQSNKSQMGLNSAIQVALWNAINRQRKDSTQLSTKVHFVDPLTLMDCLSMDAGWMLEICWMDTERKLFISRPDLPSWSSGFSIDLNPIGLFCPISNINLNWISFFFSLFFRRISRDGRLQLREPLKESFQSKYLTLWRINGLRNYNSDNWMRFLHQPSYPLLLLRIHCSSIKANWHSQQRMCTRRPFRI